MNKGFVKLSILFGAVLGLVAFAGYLLSARSSEAFFIPPQKEVCYEDCPSYKFEASRTLEQDDKGNVCPEGYDYVPNAHPTKPQWGTDYCKKLETFSTEVQYGEKSQDPNHCHRPTAKDLRVPDWAIDDYNKQFKEKIDREETQCEVPVEKSVSIDTPELSCGAQEVSLTGKLTTDAKIGDWLVVEVDGQVVLEKEVFAEDTSWQTDPISLGVGNHSAKVTLYNDNSKQTVEDEDSTDFSIDECPVDEEPQPEQPKSEPGPAGAPVCNDGKVLALAANVHGYRGDDPNTPEVEGLDTFTVRWVPTAGSSVNIYVYDGEGNLVGAEGDSPNDGHELIESLDPNTDYTFDVEQKDGCGGGVNAAVRIIDGAVSMFFKASGWVWR